MDKKFHFLITSERGKTRTFSIARKSVKVIFCLSLAMMVVSLTGINFSSENVFLKIKVAGLQRDLNETRDLNKSIKEQAARKEQEQQAMLTHALSELNQRSQVIESILSAVGVDIEIKEDNIRNVGGPYTSLPSDSYENLTFKVDHYLETLQSVPLGPPVPGTITSKYGRRIDPINRRTAFHDGVDIKNKRGTKVIAPAEGKVISRGYTRGFGNYLEIDHGNSFQTRYLHMKKSLVKKGALVKRGQAIGLLGNSGRSTGPHLHYEIKYQDKSLNPMKFITIANRIPIKIKK